MDENRGQKLEEMLLNYQQIAMNSLAGPASLWRNGVKGATAAGPPHSHRFATLAGNQISKALLPPSAGKIPSTLPFNYKLPAPSFPVLPPLLLQSDTDTSELVFCDLENRRIPGFMIGGEERLCVPPILHSVLKDIELEVIDAAFDALLIHCSRCTSYQLKLLKQERVLPSEVPTAGLIRKTDAERLCTTLLHFKPTKITDPDLRNYPQINNTCIPVYHECFGEGHGFFYTELYTHDYAKCISCADCEKLFSPDRFVTHTHFNQENKICHWGFNRRNWRSYLLLSDEEITDNDLQILEEAFTEAMDKFKNSNRKRKPEELKGSSNGVWQQMVTYSSPITSLTSNHSPNLKRRCNRPPKRAYQYVRESPTVENPDTVVSNTDKHLYGKHFVPNICLKPSPADSSSPDSTPDEDSVALDLRSPTQRQRHTSASSTAEAEMKAEAETKTDALTEEILDVESSDEPEPALPVAEESKSETGCQTDAVVISCIGELETMFFDILASSSLSEDDKNERKGQYMKCLDEIKQSM